MYSVDKSNFVLVEFPGVVKNIEKALKTFGGVSAVTAATVTNRQLELRFQPDNIYLSALIAEKKIVEEVISGQIRLVLRIRQKKKTISRIDAEQHEKNEIKNIKCLGLVSTVFTFKTMCDFHYLPVREIDKSAKVSEDLVPLLIPVNFASALNWWEKIPPKEASTIKTITPHFLPPSVFSRYTTPTVKLLTTTSEKLINDDLKIKTLTQNYDENNFELSKKVIGHAKNLRSERKSRTVCVNGNDPFPIAPTEIALNDVALRIKLKKPHEMLTEMFSERPLWTRIAMLQKTELDENVLKVILAKYAFYISSGPWGRCWCRFGYDPRLDSNSKQFQTIMVSFRDHKNIPERQRLKLSVGGNFTTPNVFNKMLDYCYRPGILPPVRQMWYCVCDVLLPTAQKVLRKDFFAVLKQCHETHGWLPPEIINSIRNAIKDDVKRVSLLLDANDEFVDGIILNESTLDELQPGPSYSKNISQVTETDTEMDFDDFTN